MPDSHPVFERYEKDYGRGWKRRLAQDLRVAETNIHSWTTSGKMSAIVETALDMLEEVNDLRYELERHDREKATMISQPDGLYTVAVRNDATGLLEAVENIRDMGLARLATAYFSGEYQAVIARVSDDIHFYLDDKDRAVEGARLLESLTGPTLRERRAAMSADLDELLKEMPTEAAVLPFPGKGTDHG